MDTIEQIQVTPGKVLVTPWSDKELEDRVKNLDKLVLNNEQRDEQLQTMMKDKIGSVLLMKCIIVNLGPDLNEKMNYHVGDYLYVFPKTFDSDFIINDKRYLIYSERNIQAKVTPSVETKEKPAKKSTIITN